MPYTVAQLFNDRESIIPATGIEQTASMEEALNTMLSKQFSQLPVVDKDKRLIGEFTAFMVTSESILRALRNLNAVPAKLKVSDAMVRVRPYRLEDQLSDLLKDLRDTYAVPIMSDKRQLEGVVTSYDTTEYFRKRAEDMIHIERIEKLLKEYITIYFTNTNDEVNEDALNAAIFELMPSNKELRGPFLQALKCYFELVGDASPSVKNKLAEQAFERYLYHKDPPRPFHRLSFDEYIRLFVQDGRWRRYKRIFLREAKEMQKFLEDIRDIRNDLAHFRVETITDEQRDKILFSEEWLESFHAAVIEEFQPGTSFESADVMEPASIPPIAIQPLEKDAPSIEVLQLEEERAGDSRYAPLAVWLQEQPTNEQAIKFTFQQIEGIIDDKLPESARERSWWANDSTGHVQSQQWLEVGWRVSKIDLREETVVFSRIKDREKLYIDFFSHLLSELTAAAKFHVRQSSPDGFNWIIISRLPQGAAQTTFLGFSFARRERFRLELYIDTFDKIRNKAIFDALNRHQADIENNLAGISGSLEWERIDDKRASRIALYHKGAITDADDKLKELRSWAVDAMIKFHRVMERYLSEVLSEAL